MNYEKDMQIDEANLDLEWLEQPTLMVKYIRHAAQCDLERDQTKEALDLLKAELDLAIRSDPEKYGLTKVTEGAIASTILMDKEYKKLNAEFQEISFESKVANNAIRAVDQRKSALENLVRLHGQQYFAGPSIPKQLDEKRTQREQDRNKKISSGLKRSR